MAVKPSSSQLVSCSFADEKGAKIYFSDGRVKTVSDKNLTPEIIEKYSDEDNNRNNMRNVAQLELSTPSFAIGEDVLLIDSPGLDAWNLDAHEKLTLETLIPTIDVCMYVTTFKTNSDKKMKEFLDIIARHDCPVIIVQNMLDSLRPGLNKGSTVAEEAKVHRNRIKNIIELSDIENKDNVEIVQISAIYALRKRCKNKKNKTEIELDTINKNYIDSNFEEFIKITEQILKQIKPSIDNNRMGNINNRMRSLIYEENNRLDSIELVEDSFKFKNLDDKIKKETLLLRKNLNLNLKKISSWHSNSEDSEKESTKEDVNTGAGNIVETIGSFFGISRDSNISEDEFNEIMIKIKRQENLIGEEIIDYNKYLSKVIGELNLSERDIISFNGLPSIPKASLKMKVETKERRVKKSSGPFGGRVARFFGGAFNNDWGYEYETYTEEVHDGRGSREELDRYIENATKRYARTINDWLEKNDATLENILNIIEKERNSFNDKQKEIKFADEVRDVMKSLSERLDKLELISGNNINKFDINSNIEIRDNNIIKEASEFIYDLTVLANNIKEEINRDVLKGVFGDENFNHNNTCVLYGDETSKDYFISRYFKDHVKSISFTDLDKENIDNYNYCFILMNTIQYGSSRKELEDYHVINKIKGIGIIGFVVQDFDELINGGGIKEGLENMLELTELTDSYIFINHDNPLYNLSFIEHQLNPRDVIAAETIYLNEIQREYPYMIDELVLKNISRILRVNLGGDIYEREIVINSGE